MKLMLILVSGFFDSRASFIKPSLGRGWLFDRAPFFFKRNQKLKPSRHKFASFIKQIAFAGTALLALSACAFLKKPAPPIILYWPLKKARLTQKFLPLKKPPHLGIDLKAPLGSPVLSAHSGRVAYAGRRLSGYGNVIALERSSRWASLYAHLQSIKVKTGQKVKPGEIIGTLGNTGRSSGAHLHFELMRDKQPVDPLLYLP